MSENVPLSQACRLEHALMFPEMQKQLVYVRTLRLTFHSHGVPYWKVKSSGVRQSKIYKCYLALAGVKGLIKTSKIWHELVFSFGQGNESFNLIPRVFHQDPENDIVQFLNSALYPGKNKGVFSFTQY